MFLRHLLLAIVTLLILSPVMASTDAWPSRPVKILVPYAAGGNSDGMARIAAQHLSEAFGQPFMVENRVGANGAIAGEAVVRSPADGYALLWAATPSVAIAPALARLPYDPIKTSRFKCSRRNRVSTIVRVPPRRTRLRLPCLKIWGWSRK
jgi:tripartite-type tricarboxylate transporter receptor subunit TctC